MFGSRLLALLVAILTSDAERRALNLLNTQWFV